jgi:hypothetical protein
VAGTNCGCKGIKKIGQTSNNYIIFVYLQQKSKLHYYIMKKVTLLFIALWGVLSEGIYAQSSLPRIMLEVTGELSNDKRISAVFTLEQTDEATGSTTTETYNCLVKYGGESSSSYDKKSYNVQFVDEGGEELYVNLLGLRQDCSKWILDAAAGDRSRMRNRVAMDVFIRYARLPYETSNAGLRSG